MDDALLVCGFERLSHLSRDGERFSDRDRSSRNAVRQRLTWNKLHDEGRRGSGSFEAVDVCDVRMVERSERLGFALEARKALRIRSKRIRDDLNRHLPTEGRIYRTIDLAHAAGANRGLDLIRSEAGTGTEGHRLSSGSARILARNRCRPRRGDVSEGVFWIGDRLRRES